MTALDAPQVTGEAYCPSCDRSYTSDLKLCPNDGTKLVDLTRPADPMIGRQIDGRFTIKERLGAGGMGVVYRAWQASVGREVAVKVIAPRPGDDSSTAKRFLREAKLASQLSQPNIVMVIDFGATEDGTLYLAMELLRGRTLSQVYRAEGAFSPARMGRVASQLCDALESAHKVGIIHRDLKPANVMILDEPAGRDFVKVLDFGLAKALDGEHESTLTQSDRVVGTPSYMAPEIITGLPAEKRSDLYSLGVMLYEMLTTRLPFSAPNANVMLAKHAYAPIPELDAAVPPQLAHVVKKLLAKKPEDRIESAAVLRASLDAAIAGTLVLDDPTSDQALVLTGDHVAGTPVSLSAPTVASGLDALPSAAPTAPSAARAPASAPSKGSRRTLGILLALAFFAAIGGTGAFLLRGGTTRAPADAAPRASIPAAADARLPAADATITAVDAGVSIDAGKPRGKDKDRDPRPRKVDAGAATRPPPIDAAPAVRIKIDAGLFVDPE